MDWPPQARCLSVLASGPLAMLRVALYAVSGLFGALLIPMVFCGYCTGGPLALVYVEILATRATFLVAWWKDSKRRQVPSMQREPLKPVFQWIGDKVQALWGWFTDLLTPVKSTLPIHEVQRQWGGDAERHWPKADMVMHRWTP